MNAGIPVAPPRVTLGFGGVRIAIECHDEAALRRWSPWFAPFTVEGEGELTIRIDPDEGAPFAATLEGLLGLHRLGPASNPVPEGIRINGGGIEVRVPPALLGEPLPSIRKPPKLINILLCAGFNLAWSRRGGGPRPALFHGCLVEVEGRGVLFTGPSGAGKSTIGSLAPPGKLIQDEAILVGRRQGAWVGSGSPLMGDRPPVAGEPLPLGLICLLEQDQSNACIPLQGYQALPEILPQLFSLCPPFPSPRERRRDEEARLGLAVHLLGALPSARLRFRPEAAVWEVIHRYFDSRK